MLQFVSSIVLTSPLPSGGLIMEDEDNFPDDDFAFVGDLNNYEGSTIDLPMSPPNTPPLAPQDEEASPSFRESSPFSGNTSMTSVDSTESIGYYREEAGRMYPAAVRILTTNIEHKNFISIAQAGVPLVLPVDHAEMRRVSNQYDLLKLVYNGNHTPEIQEMLNTEDGESRRVLDVISNTPWIDDMAEEFPHVKFVGCNFVPTRHPHNDNVQFEVYNLNEGIRGKDSSFDLIHATGTFKTTRDYKFWLAEYRRLLKPGGYLVVRDVEMALWLRDGSDMRVHCPCMATFTNFLNDHLISQGIPILQMPLVGSWLRELGGFLGVDDTVTCFPMGDWDPEWNIPGFGEMARHNISSAFYSIFPLYRRLGLSIPQIEQMVAGAIAELQNPAHQLFERAYQVIARKAVG